MDITPTDLRLEFFNEFGHWPNGEDHTDRIGGWEDNIKYIQWLQDKIIKLRKS